MKKGLLLVFFGIFILMVILMFIGGVIGQEQSTKDEYFGYWKEIFMERNNMCEEYYGNHIVIKEYKIVKEPIGEYLEVSYQVVIEWAVIEMKESPLIKPSFSGIYLDKDYIKRRSSQDYKKISQIESLEFESYFDLLSEINSLADSDNISVSKLSFGVGDPYPWGDGDPYIIFQATIDSKGEKCTEGNINLVTGEHNLGEGNCDVNLGGYIYGKPTCPDVTAPSSNFCEYGDVEEKYSDDCLTGWECFKQLSNGRKAEIKILSSAASQTAFEKLGELNFTVELKEVGKDNDIKPAYKLKAKKQGKFLGLFKIKGEVSSEIDAETGEVISIKKPWWSFLASGI